MKHVFIAGLVGLSLFTTAHADGERSDYEKSFIGREWPTTAYRDDNNALTRFCEYEGGDLTKSYRDVPGFGLTFLQCPGDGGWLMLFEAVIGRQGRHAVVKVIDALQLPAPKPHEVYWSNYDCTLNGSRGDTFIAIAPKRLRTEKVDWKSGVRLAWRPNIETGKIEALSTRHIVCWRPTPP